ncbi:golgi-body localization protein domain-containing protein [Halteromyces radiatus]|uniref:golgi-body localization protein domain-containing protein n=1 Tax=Halteromyces radiatus TaxID=101107 RepID=UPI00221E3BCA|nr:golgi-body localization protein domain-containing protein [Halteromyces radiatus]KAI8093840.1 golgi-body localization protein domain-containing protein [Halteromyces radiatus]
MVHVLFVSLFLSILTWVILKKNFEQWRLTFRLGLFSLFDFSFHNSYCTLDINKVYISLSQTYWITIYIQGINLTIHTPQLSKRHNQKFILWLLRWIRILLAIPIQWCIFLMCHYIKVHMDHISIKYMYYWLQFDALDIQALFYRIIHHHETPFSDEQQCFSMKQTQHLFRDKQLGFSLIFYYPRCSIISMPQPIVQATTSSLTMILDTSPDCLTILDTDTSLQLETLQIFLLPLLQLPINKTKSSSIQKSLSSLLKEINNDKDTIETEKTQSIWKSIRGLIEIQYFIVICDSPNNDTFYTQLKLDKFSFTAMIKEQTSLDISAESITYSLVDTSFNNNIDTDNIINFLYTLSLSIVGHHTDTISKLVVTLDHAVLSINLLKQQLLTSWVSHMDQYRILLLSSTHSNNSNNNLVSRRLPFLDMSLVLLLPKIHFQSTLDFQGMWYCTSVRWLLSGDDDSTTTSSSSSSSVSSAMPTTTTTTTTTTDSIRSAHRKKSIDLIWQQQQQQQNDTSSIYKVVFWVNIDEMNIDHWQHSRWLPWVTSKHLDLAIKANIAQSTSHQSIQNNYIDSVIGMELQATMDTPILHLCNSVLGSEPLIYWAALLNPLLPLFTTSSLSSQTKTPGTSFLHTYLQLYQRSTASLSILDARVYMVGLDEKQQRAPPSGYLDNSPLNDMITIIQFSMKKFCLETENKPSSSLLYTGDLTPPPPLLGNLRITVQQLALTQMTTFADKHISEAMNMMENEKDLTTVIGWISRVQLTLAFHYHSFIPLLLGADIKIRKMAFRYSLGNHYACLLVVKALLHVANNWQKHEVRAQHCNNNKKKQWLTINRLQCQIFRLDLHIFLPGQNELYLRADDIITSWTAISGHSLNRDAIENDNNKNSSFSMTNITLFGMSPSGKNDDDDIDSRSLEILLELDDLEWIADKPLFLENGATTTTTASSLVTAKALIRIPHGYMIAPIVENIINLVKGIRELHLRIMDKGNSYYTYFGPIPRNTPIRLPSVILQCNQLMVRLDDDPFEVKLRAIFSAGLTEQVKRLSLENEFEKEKWRHQQDGQQQYWTSSPSSSAIDPSSRQRSTINNIGDNNKLINDRIGAAQQRLWEMHSESWIKCIHHYHQTEIETHKHLRQSDYRYRCVVESLDAAYDDSDTGIGNTDCLGDDTGGDLSDLFRINIIPLPLYAPLGQLTLSETILTISQQQRQQQEEDNDDGLFPLDETIPFIHKVGKGVPLETSFSFLIPFHLHWQSGKTLVQVRDYPLPLLHVPTSTDHDQHSYQASYPFANPVAWSLSGNYVIADDLGIKEGSRILSLDTVTTMVARDDQYIPSSLYNIQVVRTASPTKVYSVVDYTVFTKHKSIICWSVSYQPAMQDILEILERITPVSVDPSAKIGFWDKLRLMIHTKVKIKFSGDFAVVVKGTRDPYKLTGRGAGMAKLWRGQVVWTLGYDNPQQEFTQVQSNSYILGVPDLLRGGYSSSLAGQDECLFLKTVIKLSDGVQMGIGCHLERTCLSGCQVCYDGTQQCRFLYFKPHHQVVFKSKDHVGDSYHDAYSGFRSNFIHLSFSIIKTSTNTTTSSLNETEMLSGDNNRNAMHLSPHFIQHFLQWYGIFGGPLSLPIRRGPLFHKDQEIDPPIKLGRHLQSLKYKIMVQPMSFGYFCIMDEQREDDVGVDGVGLKVNVHHFCVDVHQRRKQQPFDVTGEENELYRVKSNWPLHQVEIQLRHVDLRAIYTTHGTFSPSHSTSDESITSDDTLWIDHDDFIDMGWNIKSSKIMALSAKALPFAFSPSVEYVKTLDPIYVERHHHLKSTHACIMGTSKDALKIQLDYLYQRIGVVEEQIRHHQELLETTEMHLSKKAYSVDLLQEANEIMATITKLNTRRHLLSKCIQKMMNLSTINPTSSATSSDRQQSNHESTYLDDNTLKDWERLMGRFKERYTIHNPQIIWTTQVHDIVSRWRDARAQYYIHSYNISSRATQLLRELVERYSAHEDLQQQQRQYWSNNGNQKDNSIINDKNDDQDLNSNSAMHLLNKLWADRKEHFVVLNEQKTTNNSDDNDPPLNNNKPYGSDNNPHFQLDQIPEGYDSENMTLIDLWNPQVFLQGNNHQDRGILVTNERVQVKQFEIIETDNCDVDTCMVKKRTVASMDGVQLFVVKRGPMDPVDLLLDNHYGVLEQITRKKHVLSPWIPPEMLMDDYIGKYHHSERFVRFDSSIIGTIQYDRYNPIRSSSAYQSNNNNSQPDWEDQCNSTHLDFPNFTFTANPYQYSVLYQVIVDIILFRKEPRLVERTNRLRDITFSIYASGDSPSKILEDVMELQEKIRFYSGKMDDYYQQYILSSMSNALLDIKDQGDCQVLQQHYHSARQKRGVYQEALFLLMQSFKQIMHKYHQHGSINNKDDNNRLNANSTERSNNNIVNQSIGKLRISVESLVWKMLQDDGSPFSQWDLSNTNYMLITHKDQSLCHTIEIDKLVVKNTSLSPVYKQVVGPFFEKERNPSIDSQMTHDFSRHKMIYGRLVSLQPVGGISVIQHLEINLFPLRLQLTYGFWRALVAYLFPPSPPPLSSNSPSSSVVSISAIQPSSSKPILQRERTFDHHPFDFTQQHDTISLHSNADTGTWFGGGNEKQSIFGRTSAPPSIHHPVQKDSATTTKRTSWVNGALPKLSSRRRSSTVDDLQDDNDLTIMKQRASNNKTFILIKIPGAKHCLSFQGAKSIYDLENFRFRQPHLEYRNKTWSWYDLVNALKKDFRKAVIKHSPALIKEKLKPRRLLSDPNKTSVHEQTTHHTTSSACSSDLVVPDISQGMVDLGIDGWFDDDDDDNSSESSNDKLSDIYYQGILDTFLDDLNVGNISDNNNDDDDLVSLHSNGEGRRPTFKKLSARNYHQGENSLLGKAFRWLPSSSSLSPKKGKYKQDVDTMDDHTQRLLKGRLLFGKSYR